MSIESHPSPTGSSSSSLFSGGGGSGANETLTQPSPVKPTWAQILNSNPNAPSNSAASATAANNNITTAAGNNIASSSSSPPSQHSATTKTISPSASGTSNATGSRPAGFMPSFYEQQQQQSQMNWPINFNQSSSSSWMMNSDDSQRQPTNSSQQSMDNLQPGGGGGGDGFDRRESSSPTSDWNKPVTTNNSTANGWSNFQQSAPNNPSRSNANSNQWPEINNFYGTNTPTSSFNLPQQNTDNNSSSGTWQDPSGGNASDTLSLTSSSKHKTSLSGAVKTALALGGGNVDLLSGNSDAMISYAPQPKLVEQLGWDEPEINVIKRGNFDDGTSVWGDPMESMSVPVKKWTNGTKAALTNSTNTISQQQQLPPPQQQQQQQQQQQVVPKPVSTPSSSTPGSQMVLNDENWPKQHPTPTIAPPPISQWNDPSSSSASVVNASNDQSNLSQPPNYRPQQTNWNSQNQPSNDWLENVVDTSDWGLQRSQHKTAFDPYEDQIDTTSWGVQSAAAAAAAGMSNQMPMGRNPFLNEYDLNENPRDVRMSGYDNQQINDPYRQNADLKSPMMNLPGMLPSSHHAFPPRPGPLYSSQGGSILRPINPNGNLPTPPSSAGAMMGQGSHLSPKLPTSSPIPNQASYAPLSGKPTNTPNQTSQTPTPSQQVTGNGSNNNNGAVHAQIMQQFRLAVQAGLISQDLLNTKLPPFMLQLLQKLFELQQKFQHLSLQLSELTKNKARVPMAVLQSEYDRLSKAITQKKQEMLYVQKEIQEAHQKLRQQSTNQTSTPTQMMPNGPALQNSDQFRLNQWTKQSTIGQQRTSIFPPPPGLSQKDWQTDNNDPSDSWENSQTNESNNNNNNNPNSTNNNQIGNVDAHMNQVSSSSTFSDPFSNLVDDIDGPPPFVPGQLWNWKSSLPNVEDDPHVTPSSFTTGPKGPGSSMGNLNIGGAESAFSNHQSMHPYQRSLQSNRSQWPQSSSHDQQTFQPPMNDWPKQQQQYRGTSKGPPPPHPGNYRSYM